MQQEEQEYLVFARRCIYIYIYPHPSLCKHKILLLLLCVSLCVCIYIVRVQEKNLTVCVMEYLWQMQDVLHTTLEADSPGGTEFHLKKLNLQKESDLWQRQACHMTNIVHNNRYLADPPRAKEEKYIRYFIFSSIKHFRF